MLLMVEIEDLALFRSSTATSGIPCPLVYSRYRRRLDISFIIGSLEVEMEDKKASLALVRNSGSDGSYIKELCQDCSVAPGRPLSRLTGGCLFRVTYEVV